MTIYIRACAAVFALMAMAGSAALAQQPAQSPNTTGCTPQEKSAANTSEKLGQSNGVICPPDVVDPGSVKNPPAKGNMPVIPPPGSPGGNPQVRPK
jgi:hypothetical protein